MTNAPRFIGVHLAVADMTASASFYRLVGLSLPDDADLGDHVEVDLGGSAHLALSTEGVVRTYDPGWRPPQGPSAIALQFELPAREAVDAAYERLTAAGHHGHLPPVDAFWGNRYAEVDDPDGNIVGFHSRPDPTSRA